MKKFEKSVDIYYECDILNEEIEERSSLIDRDLQGVSMKRNGRSAWQIEESISKVVQAAFTKNGYGDDVAVEIRQETGEYYEVLVSQDGERGGVGAIDFNVMKEIDKTVEVDAIQPDYRGCFCFEVRIEGD